jgi:NADPH2:quinone reductase
MTRAIQIDQPGGPNALKWREVEVGDPGKGEVRIRHRAIGLNFLDTYFRSGLYKAPSLPFVPGNEGAGDVVAVGRGVGEFKPGDRVAYVGGLGAYAEERLVPADRLVKLPRGVSDEQAAAVMLKGLTAHYLLRRTFKVKKGDTILCHAAAGGVGHLLCQWADALGVTVIGTAGGAAKVKIAKANGCRYVIDYKTQDFVERVRKITKGAGVDVVYDGVGKDTYPGSLDCLRPLGMWVLFGQSSGPPPPLEMATLAQKGSLFATRPTLFTYIAKREDLLKGARELFRAVANGAVKIEIDQRYALKDAAKAHRDLEARKTTGATVLLP